MSLENVRSLDKKRQEKELVKQVGIVQDINHEITDVISRYWEVYPKEVIFALFGALEVSMQVYEDCFDDLDKETLLLKLIERNV